MHVRLNDFFFDRSRKRLRSKAICAWLWAIVFYGVVCAAEPIAIDFFYEPGCQTCEQIETELFPEIEIRFPQSCIIHRHDIGIESNFFYLLQMEAELHYTASKRAYLIINRQVAFGASPNPQKVFSLISNVLEQGITRPAPSQVEANEAKVWFSGFTLPTVLAAGLMDGLNPCSISTLIFFTSLLTVSKIRNRQLLRLGLSFGLASFLTYFALGFGFFRLLYLFSGFIVLRTVAEWLMIAVLLILSGLSMRDAFRYKKTGCAAEVTLQLSAGMKRRIHGVMRRGLGRNGIVLGGGLIGVTVTILESVCTGQIYVPTLVFILKNSTFSETRAWGYLLAYNVMFILPLVVVFMLIYFGLRTETLLAWSRRNVVISKLLLSLFFILMALMICLL